MIEAPAERVRSDQAGFESDWGIKGRESVLPQLVLPPSREVVDLMAKLNLLDRWVLLEDC